MPFTQSDTIDTIDTQQAIEMPSFYGLSEAKNLKTFWGRATRDPGWCREFEKSMEPGSSNPDFAGSTYYEYRRQQYRRLKKALKAEQAALHNWANTWCA